MMLSGRHIVSRGTAAPLTKPACLFRTALRCTRLRGILCSVPEYFSALPSNPACLFRAPAAMALSPGPLWCQLPLLCAAALSADLPQTADEWIGHVPAAIRAVRQGLTRELNAHCVLAHNQARPLLTWEWMPPGPRFPGRWPPRLYNKQRASWGQRRDCRHWSGWPSRDARVGKASHPAPRTTAASMQRIEEAMAVDSPAPIAASTVPRALPMQPCWSASLGGLGAAWRPLGQQAAAHQRALTAAENSDMAIGLAREGHDGKVCAARLAERLCPHSCAVVEVLRCLHPVLPEPDVPVAHQQPPAPDIGGVMALRNTCTRLAFLDRGQACEEAAPVFAGARLVGIPKPKGGLRPAYWRSAAPSYWQMHLAPTPIRVVAPSGVHATRAWLTRHQTALLKLDLLTRSTPCIGNKFFTASWPSSLSCRDGSPGATGDRASAQPPSSLLAAGNKGPLGTFAFCRSLAAPD